MEKNVPTVTLGGQEFELAFTTEAMLQFSKKYGGVENAGKMMQEGDAEEKIRVMIWIITLMINQGIEKQNMLNLLTGSPEKPRRLVTEQIVRVLLPLNDIRELKQKIMTAICIGMGREIPEELVDEDLAEIQAEKNVTSGTTQ
ncbi:hypothetical protein [Solibaculum mannosilyticum]|uniref:Uncharacterized protein n=1 Tax=Solibaculum mannosilyticum TaxID=2780922 RepID=A0A7I8D1Z5_9FIRM|nr:hypothetical protein [Solibaculum mannosilyticum]BCI60850.1 hypothetical protein C12CBH8_14890 [Solibaculum mannosilyticum]